jgi:hypothetical protein
MVPLSNPSCSSFLIWYIHAWCIPLSTLISLKNFLACPCF